MCRSPSPGLGKVVKYEFTAWCLSIFYATEAIFWVIFSLAVMRFNKRDQCNPVILRNEGFLKKKNQYLDQSTFGSESINPSDSASPCLKKKSFKKILALIWKRQNCRKGKQTRGAPGLGSRRRGWLWSGRVGVQLKWQNSSGQNCGAGYMILCTCQNWQNYTPRRLNFAVCKMF